MGIYQDELGGVKISKADRQRLMLKGAAKKGQGIIEKLSEVLNNITQFKKNASKQVAPSTQGKVWIPNHQARPVSLNQVRANLF